MLVKMQINEIIHNAITKSDANPRHVKLLLAHALRTTQEELILKPDREVSDIELQEFESLLARLVNEEPVSKILGQREFWNDTFKVTKDTLDPRPETETIIESVLKYFPDKSGNYKILDLGTGTGCIILSLLREYPNATGLGVDISSKALEVAKENAHTLGIDRIEFKEGNWCEGITHTFDIIVSNPPYIKDTEQLPDCVKNFDPGLALFAGDDGLSAYRQIAASIHNVCNNNTMIFLEIGQGQETEVSNIFAAAGFNTIENVTDLAGIIRCLICSSSFLK